MARGRKKRANLMMNFGNSGGFYKKKKYFKRFKRRKRKGGY